MAEERRIAPPGGETAQTPPRALSTKKKKKRSKSRLLFFLSLLAFGAGTGLHFSGLWDARPLVWSIVPQVPYVGTSVSRFFDIPEQYTLTVAQRRAFELEEWQKRLDERERKLGAKESAVDTASGDLGARMENLNRQASAAQNREESVNAEKNSEQQLIDQVVRTYQDMSARNAAQIVEQVTEPLAVELLQKLPADARASILGKMDPRKAARLTELMAGGQ
ncbi:MAG: MgtE intracellular region [Synergistaceae bacterium]|jgi:flagellar motility protein MotE (MotC chaperone)|nr:MgtE intracellular region [Synergistaceae bacterium]